MFSVISVILKKRGDDYVPSLFPFTVQMYTCYIKKSKNIIKRTTQQNINSVLQAPGNRAAVILRLFFQVYGNKGRGHSEHGIDTTFHA